MKSILKVINDRVLIKPDAPKKYEGALEIPDAYRAFYENLPETGEVVSFGDKCKYKWEIGQRVHFAKMAVSKLIHNDQEYLVIREYDINALT